MTITDILLETLPYLIAFLLFAGLLTLGATKRCDLTERFLRLIDRGPK